MSSSIGIDLVYRHHATTLSSTRDLTEASTSFTADRHPGTLAFRHSLETERVSLPAKAVTMGTKAGGYLPVRLVSQVRC